MDHGKFSELARYAGLTWTPIFEWYMAMLIVKNTKKAFLS